MLRSTGHQYVQEEHRHGDGCAHEQPAVQRSAVHDVLSGSGRPLATDIRTEMETRLGADFSDVRVHDDSAAGASAAEIGARAYTSGSHVVIGDGGGDKHTLAHELTHVIQQRQGPVTGTDNGSGLRVSDPSDRFEREAEANARRAMSEAPPLQRAAEASAPAVRSAGAQTLQRMPKAPKRTGKSRATSQSAKDLLVSALTHTHGWQAYGGAQNKTVHLTNAPKENKDANLKANEKIYKGSDNTRQPKSYAGNRTMQGMRWISTLAKDYLTSMSASAAEEVQATVIDGTMYISANRNTHNELLRGLAGQHKTGRAFAKALIEAVGDQDAPDRFPRHAGKLADRVSNAPADNTGDYGEIASVAVKVPDDVSKDDDGFHAERRLAALPGFDAKKTIGVKRPCVVCFTQIYAELQEDGDLEVYPGPLWPSAAANKGMENYKEESVADYAKYLHETVEKAGGTRISFTQAGEYTWDQNSDSDTDRDGNPVNQGQSGSEMEIDSEG
ncbi:DUF4157 domain-containing protein [Streptomyces sp. NBC_00344]